jgi:YVTN family beta-propeller protein
MVLANGKAFIANYDSQRVEIINPATDTKTGHINVVGHPLDMVLDKQGQLWVLGQKEGSQAAALNRINPTTESVELNVPFPSSESPSRLVMDPAGDFLYYLNNEGVYKLATTATALPATPLVAKAGRNFYGLGISPDNLQLYIADALDYNQRSDVYVYSLPSLAPTDTFKTGIISGGFYFYPR